MKHFARIITGLALGTFLLTSIAYSADEKGKASKPAVKSDNELAADLEAAWGRRIPELLLGDNLPLEEVARQIGRQFPEVNFIVPENAREAIVPGIWLRHVTLSEILKAIELASMGRIRASGVEKGPVKIDAATGLPSDALERRNIIGFMVAPPSRREAQPPSPSCRVFSLAPYLEGRSDKEYDSATRELYEALEAAWAMMQKSGAATQKPQLSIHPGTKLLIAVGREQELAVIDQVVSQLQSSALLARFPAAGRTKAPERGASATPRPSPE